MEPYITKDCSLRAQRLPHGYETCSTDRCRICVDGQWVEKDRLVELLG